jgi:SGNH domain (fused to AT3 domains)
VPTHFPKRLAVCGLVAFSLLGAACGSSGSPSTTTSTTSAPSTSVAPGSTWQSTPSQVLQSKDIKQVPADLNPPLSQAASTSSSFKLSGSSYMQAQCDPYDTVAEAQNPTPCIYGDSSSSKVMVLFGDSHVGNWTPALDIVAKNLGYKLAMFEFAGCSTSPIKVGSSSPREAACLTWHTTLPKAVQALHPAVVIAVSGPSFEVQTSAQRADWASHLGSMFDEMTSGNPTAQRVLLGTSPLMTSPSPVCLSIHPSSVPSCALSGASALSYYNNYLARDSVSAAAAKARLIPVRQWFCAPTYCGPIIGSTLVYIDQDHTTIAYSTSLAPVLQEALQSSL